jgi:hypothetical protein
MTQQVCLVKLPLKIPLAPQVRVSATELHTWGGGTPPTE